MSESFPTPGLFIDARNRISHHRPQALTDYALLDVCQLNYENFDIYAPLKREILARGLLGKLNDLLARADGLENH